MESRIEDIDGEITTTDGNKVFTLLSLDSGGEQQIVNLIVSAYNVALAMNEWAAGGLLPSYDITMGVVDYVDDTLEPSTNGLLLLENLALALQDCGLAIPNVLDPGYRPKKGG